MKLNSLDAIFNKHPTLSTTNPDGSPKKPKFGSIVKNDGTLRDQFVVQDQNVTNNLNTDFLDRLRQEGLRKPGEQSTWRKLQQQNIIRQAGSAQQQIQGAQQQALDQMAMRGGVGAGTAERMAGDNVRQNLQSQQQTFGLGLQANLADEQNRLSSLANLGNAEMGVAQLDLGTQQFNVGNSLANQRFNTQNALGQKMQQRAFDANTYNKAMEAWAAEKTAEAAPSGGGGKK